MRACYAEFIFRLTSLTRGRLEFASLCCPYAAPRRSQTQRIMLPSMCKSTLHCCRPMHWSLNGPMEPRDGGELTPNTKNTYAETISKWPSGLDLGGSWGQPWITPPAAASGASWSCSSNKTSSTFGSRFGGNLAVERHGGAASPTQGAEKRYFLTPLSIKVLRLP